MCCSISAEMRNYLPNLSHQPHWVEPQKQLMTAWTQIEEPLSQGHTHTPTEV